MKKQEKIKSGSKHVKRKQDKIKNHRKTHEEEEAKAWEMGQLETY